VQGPQEANAIFWGKLRRGKGNLSFPLYWHDIKGQRKADTRERGGGIKKRNEREGKERGGKTRRVSEGVTEVISKFFIEEEPD